MRWNASANLDQSSELALVERCRKNDAEAFGRIVDLYQSRVFGFVRRMCPDPEEAADIAQETFIRAYQGLHRFDGRASFRTWLFRIAYNLCVDRARRSQRRPDEMRLDHPHEADEQIDLPDTRWDPATQVLDGELQEVVRSAVERMSEKLRAVLLLHDSENMAYDEIAAALNIPVGTVKSRLFLARAHLQQAVTGYWNE